MHSVSQMCSSKDTLESARIQNRPPPWLTIGLGNSFVLACHLTIYGF